MDAKVSYTAQPCLKQCNMQIASWQRAKEKQSSTPPPYKGLSTHPSTCTFSLLVETSFCKEALAPTLVIASAGLDLPLI
jgi:hypothetical protein